jgi:hypothetical protein
MTVLLKAPDGFERPQNALLAPLNVVKPANV